jgi:hypothetical protein
VSFAFENGGQAPSITRVRISSLNAVYDIQNHNGGVGDWHMVPLRWTIQLSQKFPTNPIDFPW